MGDSEDQGKDNIIEMAWELCDLILKEKIIESEHIEDVLRRAILLVRNK